MLCDRLSTTTSFSNTHSSPNEPSSSWFVGSSSLETADGMWVAAYIPSQVTGGRSQIHNYLYDTNHPGGSEYFDDVIMYDYTGDEIGNSRKLKQEYYMNPITRASLGLPLLNQPAYYMYLTRSSSKLYWPSNTTLREVDWGIHSA